jgi:anti-anti-sigma regulatory factor
MAEAMPESVPFIGAASQPDLEVATLSADTLRASIRVVGTLAPSTASLVTSILRTHVSAGRRYLRVDLSGAQFADEAVIAALVSSHRTISDLGGMLVFENAGPRMVDAIRSATLFVNARA